MWRFLSICVRNLAEEKSNSWWKLVEENLDMKRFQYWTILVGAQDTFSVLRTQLDNNVAGKEKQKKEELIWIFISTNLDLLTSPLPNDTLHIKAIGNARLLYDSCVNESAIELADAQTILSVLNNEFAGWPILQGSAWNETKFNLTRLLVKLREYNNNFIFYCGTMIDDKNSSTYHIRVRRLKSRKKRLSKNSFLRFIQVSQSDLGLERRHFYQNDSKIAKAYLQFMQDLAMSLTSDKSIVSKHVEEIYNFEKKLAEVTKTKFFGEKPNCFDHF